MALQQLITFFVELIDIQPKRKQSVIMSQVQEWMSGLPNYIKGLFAKPSWSSRCELFHQRCASLYPYLEKGSNRSTNGLNLFMYRAFCLTSLPFAPKNHQTLEERYISKINCKTSNGWAFLPSELGKVVLVLIKREGAL